MGNHGDTKAAAIPPQEELERRAFNQAFRELAFAWYWDTGTYLTLLCIEDQRERLRRYLETERPGILAAYPIDFLVNLICDTQKRVLQTAAAAADFAPARGWTPAMHSTESIA
ncbi:MAG TPA: hypothetical protein VF928_02325 [Usitatibacteraceae bacterium]